LQGLPPVHFLVELAVPVGQRRQHLGDPSPLGYDLEVI